MRTPATASTPTPAAGYSQNNQAGNQRVDSAVPSTSSIMPIPVPPVQHMSTRSPLPTTPQALTTTYASRLRTGATLLMQPILASASNTTTGSRTGTRRGGVINYAEPNSGDEIEPDAGERERDSDDSDFIASGGTRSAIRATRTRTGGAAGFFQYSFQQSHQASPMPQGKLELDQSYLGMVPPAKFITAKRAEPTKHEYP